MEESSVIEFKGHRSFVKEEIPGVVNFTYQQTGRASRQPVSKYACGMLNSGKGGIILMGVLDNGQVEGMTMTRFQMDHIKLAVQDALDRYVPRVPLHLYKLEFVPVIDDNLEEDYADIMTCMKTMDLQQDPSLPHHLRTNDHCWCDAGSLAKAARGLICPSFVIELHIFAPCRDDPRNQDLYKVCNLAMSES